MQTCAEQITEFPAVIGIERRLKKLPSRVQAEAEDCDGELREPSEKPNVLFPLTAVPRAPDEEQSENHEDYDQGRDEPVRPHPAHPEPSSVVHQVRFSRWASPPAGSAYRPGSLSNFALQEAEQNT
jgi:hypothetical protein